MNILLNGPIARRGRATLEARLGGRAAIAEAGDGEGTDARARGFAEAEVLITVAFDGNLPPAPDLKLIHLPVSGLDALDVAAVPEGCPVCNVHEHAIGVSEYVLAAMLAWTLGLAERSARFKAGSWAESPRLSGPLRPELSGRTVGLVGYGHIGQAVAERVRPFGMRVLAITRSAAKAEAEAECIGTFDALPRLLSQADFLVLACPLTEATRGLIGARELILMKPGAVLINVARAHLVDEDPLYEALEGGAIAGAALDPWYLYPAPGDASQRPSSRPFHSLDNVIMTPHLASWTEGLIARRFAVIAENIERLGRGEPLVNQVHPAAS